MGIRYRSGNHHQDRSQLLPTNDDDDAPRLLNNKRRQKPWLNMTQPARQRIFVLLMSGGLVLAFIVFSTVVVVVSSPGQQPQQHKPTFTTAVGQQPPKSSRNLPQQQQPPKKTRAPKHATIRRQYPRVYQMTDQISGLAGTPSLAEDYEEDKFQEQALNFTQPPLAPPDNPDCIPMAAWQTASYPTCNNLHEISVQNGLLQTWLKPVRNESAPAEMLTQSTPELNLLAKGWFRHTWELHNPRATIGRDVNRTTIMVSEDDSNIVVLKTLRLEREFLAEYYELHNRDAVAMERLTFSPYVVNVYGYCGQSAINEYADFPFGANIKSLEQLSRRMRSHRDDKTMMLRLVQAYGLAAGLAHLHRAGAAWEVTPQVEQSLRQTQQPATIQELQQPALMVHYDINPRNIALFKGGKPKINDFNIAEFVRYNPKTGQTCGFKSRMHAPWWRSPEEVVESNDTHPVYLNEKVDIYALGNVLSHLFTSFSPRGKMIPSREEMVRQLVANGTAPQLLPAFQNETGSVSEMFRKVIALCHQPQPTQRPTAQELANMIRRTLMEQKSHLMDLSSSTSSQLPPASEADESDDDGEDQEVMEEKG